MADIELVIKIPEEAYKRRKCGDISPWITDAILDAVANGKPLDDVLDKIKEEIFLLSDKECNGNTVTIYSWSGMQRKVFDIIDQYKSEGSEKK